MSERAKELAGQFLRYAREEAEEWVDSVEDSPPSHFYTALIGAALIKVFGWIL